jgi:hypothetical protein
MCKVIKEEKKIELSSNELTNSLVFRYEHLGERKDAGRSILI